MGENKIIKNRSSLTNSENMKVSSFMSFSKVFCLLMSSWGHSLWHTYHIRQHVSTLWCVVRNKVPLWLFPGIISMVIFTVLCIMVFVIRHLFRHKGSYHTNEAKGAESADCADAAIIVNDPAFTETIDESKKEWFIWTPLTSVDTWHSDICSSESVQ